MIVDHIYLSVYLHTSADRLSPACLSEFVCLSACPRISELKKLNWIFQIVRSPQKAYKCRASSPIERPLSVRLMRKY